MIDKVKETLKRFSMLKEGARVLLCVSGGPDSVAMLSVFNSLKKAMHLELFIAHLNHKLRGIDSDRDEEYVKVLSKRYRIPIVTAQEDIKTFARSNKLTLEEAARKARYNFFLKAAEQLNIDVIATAHTRDDQAETVLMRLLRGTGLRGLRGISPARKLNGFILIRPLIDIARREIEDYLYEKKIKPRLDITNLIPGFFRNRVRLKLLPLLEKEYSPRIKELLSSLADLLEEDYDYLNLQQEKAFKKLAKITKENTITFHLATFKRVHLSMQRALVRKAIEFLKGTLDRIEYRHWQELEAVIYKKPPGSIVHLPGEAEAIKTKTTLKFRKGHRQKSQRKRLEATRIKIPGVTHFGKRSISVRILKRYGSVNKSSPSGQGLGKSSAFSELWSRHPRTEEYFDIEKADLPLILRLREPGDRMKPLGMKGYKKIKDIFIDEKIPLKARNNIPLVVSASGEILWLCGIKMSDRCKISSSTKRVLKLKYCNHASNRNLK